MALPLARGSRLARNFAAGVLLWGAPLLLIAAVFVGSVGVGALLTPLGVEVLGIRGTLAVVGAAVCGAVVLSARRMADADGRLAPPPHLSLLRGVPFLAPLPEAVLERLAFSATPVRVPAGSDVFVRGDVGDRFYVVIDGEAEILGRPFGPGSWFGEIALLRDVPRTATVSATTDLHLLAVGRDDFVPAVTGHGDALAEAEALVTARLLRG